MKERLAQLPAEEQQSAVTQWAGWNRSAWRNPTAERRKAAVMTETTFSANGSKWRLRSLVAMGHSGRRMALALGISEDRVHRLLNDKVAEIDGHTFWLVHSLWEAWWDKRPPARSRAEKAAITVAYQRAARKRWPTPANLDEEDLDRIARLPAEAGLEARHWRCGGRRLPAGRLRRNSEGQLITMRRVNFKLRVDLGKRAPKRIVYLVHLDPPPEGFAPDGTHGITSVHRKISPGGLCSTAHGTARTFSACTSTGAAAGMSSGRGKAASRKRRALKTCSWYPVLPRVHPRAAQR